jgi:hypothetical protein
VLEVIDVGHDKRDGGAIESRLAPRGFEAGVEVTAVGEPGEAIAEGQGVEIVVEAGEFFGAELFTEKEDVGEAVGELDAVVGDGSENGAAGYEREGTDAFAVGEPRVKVEIDGIGEEEGGDEGQVEGQAHAQGADGGEYEDEVDLRVDAGDGVIDRGGSDAAYGCEKADGEADDFVEDGMTALMQEERGERCAGGEEAVSDEDAVPDVDRVKAVVDEDEEEDDERAEGYEERPVVVAEMFIAVITGLELGGKAQPEGLLRPGVEEVRELLL